MVMYKPTKLVTVHIPMAVELRDVLKLKAQYFGFGSIQEFFRFWAMAQVEGRKIDWNDEDWEPAGLIHYIYGNDPIAESLKPPSKQPPQGWGWR